MLPAEGTAARTAAEAIMSDAGSLGGAGFQFAASVRNACLTDEERAGKQSIYIYVYLSSSCTNLSIYLSIYLFIPGSSSPRACATPHRRGAGG